MLSPFIALVLAASSGPPSLTAPGLNSVSIDARTLSFYSEHLAQQLSIRGIKIVTPRDMTAVLGVERQKELLGCNSDSSGSCVAELAAAAGTDGVLVGDVAKVGDLYQINLRIVSAANGRLLAQFSGQAPSDEEVTEVLTQAAKQMAPVVAQALGKTVTVSETALLTFKTSRLYPARRFTWIPLAGAGAAAVGAGLLYLRATQMHQELINPATPSAQVGDPAALAASGSLSQTLSGTLAVVALAGVVTAGVLYLMPGSVNDAPIPHVAIGPRGVLIAGTWP